MSLILIDSSGAYAYYASFMLQRPCCRHALVGGLLGMLLSVSNMHAASPQAYVCEGARTPYTNQHLPSLQWRNCPEYQYEFPAVSISNNSRAQESPTISTPLPGGCRRGVLTSTGYQASYEVGAYLRAQYVAHYRLLSPSYQPNSLQASSSSSQASFDSLQGVLAGLYPNIDSVVPVTTAGSDAEGIADAECPALDRFLKRLKLMQMSQGEMPSCSHVVPATVQGNLAVSCLHMPLYAAAQPAYVAGTSNAPTQQWPQQS